MSELFLIRHAQASFGSENYDQLSELGHRQSRWLGEYLAVRKLHFDRVLLGDMVRHRETLEGLSAGLVQHPDYAELQDKIAEAQVLPELNEFDFQAIANAFIKKHPELMPKGKPSKKEYYYLFKQALYQWQDDLLGDDLPESFAQFSSRIIRFLETTSQAHAGEKVLVVTSGGAISRSVSQILSAPASSMIELNLQIRNSSLTHCFFNQDSMRLHSFNEVPHLDNKELRQHITYS